MHDSFQDYKVVDENFGHAWAIQVQRLCWGQRHLEPSPGYGLG